MDAIDPTMIILTTENILNVTSNNTTDNLFKNEGKMFAILVKIAYAIGIIGNAAAIIALRKGERRIRNRKHLLLLTSLAANDLVALVSRFVRDSSIFLSVENYNVQSRLAVKPSTSTDGGHDC